jgi:hypothetical protein
MSEVDLKKMIKIVFSQPPANPGSYKLDLSVENPVENPVDDPEFVNELAKTTANVLMNIFISGCQILFGNEITPANITEEQFVKVNKYINSFGYQTHYEYIYKDIINENGETIKKPSNLNIHFTAL